MGVSGEVSVPKPCPACGESGGLTIGRGLQARPLGSWSLAGAMLKTSAREVAVLACGGCGMRLTGWIDGGSFCSDESPGGRR